MFFETQASLHYKSHYIEDISLYTVPFSNPEKYSTVGNCMYYRRTIVWLIQRTIAFLYIYGFIYRTRCTVQSLPSCFSHYSECCLWQSWKVYFLHHSTVDLWFCKQFSAMTKNQVVNINNRRKRLTEFVNDKPTLWTTFTCLWICVNWKAYIVHFLYCASNHCHDN